MTETVEVDGRRIAYERAGDGPPLVLLHGCVGDGPTTWRRQLDGLSEEFTVLAWDAPRAGGSDDPPQESVDAFGASMRAFHPAGFRAMARASAENVRDAPATSATSRSPRSSTTRSAASSGTRVGTRSPPSAVERRRRP